MLAKKVRQYQIFWDIIGKAGRFYPISSFKRLPQNLIVELTNACNLRCPVCPTNLIMERKKGFMDFGLFKSIIDDFKSLKEKPRINMNFAGEPLLHKDIDKFVAYASENGHMTFISTNATHLTKNLSKRLLKANLSSIHLCIDGASKKSHEAYRHGSEFEEVKKNIENFLKIKQKINGNTYISIQTLITSFSENEIDELTSWAKKFSANSINFKTLSMGSHTSQETKNKYRYLLPQRKNFRRKRTKINKTLCRVPLRQAVIFWNGDLGLCCIDFDSSFNLPNIKEKGFRKTFLSEDVARKRKLGFQKKFPLCERCSLGNADDLGINVKI